MRTPAGFLISSIFAPASPRSPLIAKHVRYGNARSLVHLAMERSAVIPTAGKSAAQVSKGRSMRGFVSVVLIMSLWALGHDVAFAQATLQQAPPGSMRCLPNEGEELRPYAACSQPSRLGVPQAYMRCANVFVSSSQSCERRCFFSRCHRT